MKDRQKQPAHHLESEGCPGCRNRPWYVKLLASIQASLEQNEFYDKDIHGPIVGVCIGLLPLFQEPSQMLDKTQSRRRPGP